MGRQGIYDYPSQMLQPNYLFLYWQQLLIVRQPKNAMKNRDVHGLGWNDYHLSMVGSGLCENS